MRTTANNRPPSSKENDVIKLKEIRAEMRLIWRRSSRVLWVNWKIDWREIILIRRIEDADSLLSHFFCFFIDKQEISVLADWFWLNQSFSEMSESFPTL